MGEFPIHPFNKIVRKKGKQIASTRIVDGASFGRWLVLLLCRLRLQLLSEAEVVTLQKM